MKINRLAAATLGTAIVLTASLNASASHSWNNYHWARNTSSVTINVIDSNTSDWDDELGLARSQWSQSSKLNLSITSYDSSSSTRRTCSPPAGKIRSCNHHYGSNGWLGLASINIDSNGHITTGTSKMNDTYSSSFASQNQRRHVMCQELGHLLGLEHTSTNGSSQNTCMDYSQSSTSTAPNQHDYDQLVAIYAHTDGYSTASASAAASRRSARLTVPGGHELGMRIRKGVFEETWVAPDGEGGIWVHHIILAPGFENTDLI